jgi:outer membrane receptor for ferrienterochelin and colicins
MGFAVSKGFTLNLKTIFPFGLKIISGITIMNNTLNENGITTQQLLTENFSGTWSASYMIKKISIDYTGNVYSPMKLPLLSEYDPRNEKSPWWSIQNIQLKYHNNKKFELFGGIKNFLNWTPNKGNPFIIARANDPFDKKVIFDQSGNAKVTPENPYGLTFDPTYVYAPNQGIRFFIGINFNIE